MADILENPVDLIDDAYEQEIQVEQEMIEVVAYRSYNRLDDKPQINGVELVGNKTSSDLGITAQIESAVNSEAQARAQADNTLQGKIDTEKLARQQADSTLQGNIDAEETARKAADKDIQDVLDGETLARQNADIALGGRIDTEIHDRQVADIGLQGQIDAITSKSDVVDVVATYADLQAYDTQHLGDNDVIKVLDDETHGDALTYYRWSKTNQTWTFIGQEAPYYSKSQTDTLLLGKQNTIDSLHKLSADLVDDTSATNKFVTASDITNWNGKQDALTAGTGIDITGGVISTPAIVPEVVAELPTTGAEGKLYLTPKAHTTQTATGNPIEATITEQAGQLESFQLDGDTFQQTYTGKNLLNVEGKWSITAGAGVTVTDGADGSLILNGTVTAREDIRLYSSSDRFTLESGKTVTMSREPYSNWNLIWHRFTSESGTGTSDIKYFDPGASSFTYTTLDTDYGYQFIMRLPVGTTFNNTHVYLQLEKSSTATSFEPYVGGQPSPSPAYPQQIQTVTGEQTVEIVGKNLFNPATFVKGRLDNGVVGYQEGTSTLEATATDITFTTNANFRGITSDYISVVGGSQYIQNQQLTTDNNTGAAIAQYDSSKTFIQQDNLSTGTVITMQATTAYIRIYYFARNAGTITLHEPQLEAGSTSTSFAPYSKQTLPISLGSLELCKLGDYQDYIWKDGEDWKVHKATAKHALRADEGWLVPNPASYPNLFQTNAISDLSNLADDYATASTSPQAYCEALTYLPGSGDVRTNQGFSLFHAVEGGVAYNLARINIAGFTATTQLNDWLSTCNASFWYGVKTPTDTTITDTVLIAQLEAIRTASLENGTNTITNTATAPNLAGDMEFDYYEYDPTNRYDKWLWLDLNNNYEKLGS